MIPITSQDVSDHIEFSQKAILILKFVFHQGKGTMNTQGERPNVTSQTGCRASTFGYLAAGLGIGAALSIFLAPKSGEEPENGLQTNA